MNEPVYYVPNHPPDACRGSFCTVHNPSDHSMSEWRLVWRGELFLPLYVRVCPEHLVEHPDPDSIQFLIKKFGPHGVLASIHGCCTCTECPDAFKKPKRKGGGRGRIP